MDISYHFSHYTLHVHDCININIGLIIVIYNGNKQSFLFSFRCESEV